MMECTAQIVLHRSRKAPSTGSELLLTPSSCANARENLGRGVLSSKVRDSWLAIRKVQGRNGRVQSA